MEWNVKTPIWDWENMVVFNGRVSEENSKQEKRMDWGTEGDGGIDNGSVCSPGGGVCSGSELGNESSSKSSISVSVDSSLKTGIRVSEFSLQDVEGFPKELNEKKELGRLEDTETSPELASSVGTHEALIGLKLGKRTYFEDVCTGSAVKVNSSFSVASTSSNNHVKRPRASCQSNQTPRCQVEGCNLDLSSAKDYHRKHRVCENHSKCSKVIVAGQERRFCQQCSRFHELAEFDEKKRSCRRRLSDHNARRRKPQSDTISFNSTTLSTPMHDGRQQMNFVLNRLPLIHARPAVNPSWSGSCELKFGQAKGSWLRTTKAGGTNGQLHMTDGELPTVAPPVCHDFDKQLPYKGTIANVLDQGVEVPMAMSNIDSTVDFRRALSLLSNNSWGSGHTEPASLNQIMNLNQTSTSQPTIHAVHQSLPLASTESWQPELLSAESRASSLALHSNAGQFPEFQRFKAPYESVFLDNNSMHRLPEGSYAGTSRSV